MSTSKQLPFKNKERYSNSEAEDSFRNFADKQGWTVTKRGYPDFIVFENGEFKCFVEVKGTKNQRYALNNVNLDIKRDKRKTQHIQFQARTMDLLKSKGLDCKIWTPKDGFGE